MASSRRSVLLDASAAAAEIGDGAAASPARGGARNGGALSARVRALVGGGGGAGQAEKPRAIARPAQCAAVARAPTKAVAPMRRALSGSRAAAATAKALDANDADAQRRLRFKR